MQWCSFRIAGKALATVILIVYILVESFTIFKVLRSFNLSKRRMEISTVQIYETWLAKYAVWH
jgi:hypothetical protein